MRDRGHERSVDEPRHVLTVRDEGPTCARGHRDSLVGGQEGRDLRAAPARQPIRRIEDEPAVLGPQRTQRRHRAQQILTNDDALHGHGRERFTYPRRSFCRRRNVFARGTSTFTTTFAATRRDAEREQYCSMVTHSTGPEELDSRPWTEHPRAQRVRLLFGREEEMPKHFRRAARSLRHPNRPKQPGSAREAAREVR